MTTVGPPMAPQLAAGSSPVLRDVLQEHLEEIAFLSIQRRKLLFAPDVPLIPFPPHDERIAAHWDGLVTGMPGSVQVALERIEEFDPWEGYAAARVWIELGGAGAADVAPLIAATDPELHGTWRETLRRLSPARLALLFPAEAPPPSDHALLAAVVYAHGWHGTLREPAAAAAALATDPLPRYAAARALGWCAGTLPGAASLLSGLLTDPEDVVRRAALWSIALVQPQAAADRCRRQVRAGEADVFDLRVLGLLGGAGDEEALGALLGKPTAPREAALRALGDLGTPAALELLVFRLAAVDEPIPDVVKEAVRSIVGGTPDIEPEDGAAGGAAAGGAAPDKVLSWWRDAAPAWQAELRWLRGQPFPWRGPAAEEPMEALWRSLLLMPRPELEWLRREVPDGFFEDLLRDDAVPGE